MERTYEDLSKEFRQEYPRVLRLIPKMYDRLTLVDNLSHKHALNKIYNEHKDLPGFSRRNIHRHLPSDNPNVPHRVVPSWHKSSITELNQPTKLSNTKSSDRDEHSEVKPTIDEINSPNTESPDCKVLIQKIRELEHTIQELEERENETSIPFHDLRMHMIRQYSLSGEREPVLIYARPDLTHSKSKSFTLGKKSEQN